MGSSSVCCSVVGGMRLGMRIDPDWDAELISEHSPGPPLVFRSVDIPSRISVIPKVAGSVRLRLSPGRVGLSWNINSGEDSLNPLQSQSDC